MLSLYRISPSTKIHTRKQKTSKLTEHDLKMAPNYLKVTSKADDKTVSKTGKTKKNNLKGSDPKNDNASQGSILIEQAFSSN